MGPEGGETGEIMNQDVIDMASDAVNSLFGLLYQRMADVLTIHQWHYTGSDRVYRDAVSNLGRISEVVDASSQLISTYLSNNTTHKGRHIIIHKKDIRVRIRDQKRAV